MDFAMQFMLDTDSNTKTVLEHLSEVSPLQAIPSTTLISRRKTLAKKLLEAGDKHSLEDTDLALFDQTLRQHKTIFSLLPKPETKATEA